jgi:LacI family transcriptional regulator
MSSQLAERVTIRDVARLAGVSIATVSRVFNGRTDVAPETRDAVLEVAREHGYAGRRPRANRAGLVGVTLPNIRSPYFAYLVSGVVEALSEHDLRVILCPTLHEHDREVGLLERLLHGTTDGAVLVLPAESSEELLALQRQGLPYVVLDPREPLPPGIPCVAAANASGAREATRHLLELGHRRIAAVTGPPDWSATVERLAGYHAALAGAGVAPDPRLELESDFLVAGGQDAGARLLDLPDPPTAVVAFNDELAVGVVASAAARGIRVPDELSVVGFDDSDFAALVTPALTTVRQPLAEMGRVAVTLLTRLIERRPLDALRVEIATTLVVRDSTASPR